MFAESKLDEKNSENEMLNQELQKLRISKSILHVHVYVCTCTFAWVIPEVQYMYRNLPCIPIDTTKII